MYRGPKKMVNRDQTGKKMGRTWFEFCRVVLELLALALILAVCAWVCLFLAVEWWSMVAKIERVSEQACLEVPLHCPKWWQS